MTVPAATSASCATRECGECRGKAVSVLTGRTTDCTCSCHRKAK